MCFDRYRNSLYAAVTDSVVYEFAISTNNDYCGMFYKFFYVMCESICVMKLFDVNELNVELITIAIIIVSRYIGGTIESFYVHVDVCPSSDFLICGSANSAVIWDLQESNRLRRRYERANETISNRRLPYPKFCLGGHRDEVVVVSFEIIIYKRL